MIYSFEHGNRGVNKLIFFRAQVAGVNSNMLDDTEKEYR